MAIIPIFIPHAGCPHQCVFCNQKTISGQKTAALEGAKEQINRWLERVKPSVENEAAFYGGSFTGLDITLQKELLALTDELLARKVIGSVRLSTRPDYIDDERLELLRNHGVKLVELGVQSLDDKVLAAAERGHTAEQVTNAVALLKKYDFKVGLQLMVGMPEQDFASVKDTVEKVLALKPDIARIYPLLVIKGTPLAKSYEAGEFEPLSLEEAVEQAAYMYKKLSEAGIKIIRVGLQPDDELCAEGNILAGPFHPSMGELVQSYLLREKLTPQILEIAKQNGEAILILCPRRLESKLRGIRNSNIHYWSLLISPIKLIVKSVDVSEIKIICIPSNDWEKAATHD
ncbi:MAG: radical SAM protein [Phascolarctobacterium sp.]|nr:radical SAM protein [Phascolarctobacterium sp.]